MTAAAANRPKAQVYDRYRQLGMAASVTIYENVMVARDSSGYLRPARATNTDRVVGVARQYKVNGSSAGATLCEFENGAICKFANSSSGDAISAAHVGQSVYIVDDSTVALTSNSGARPRAGRVFLVESDGVWVEVGAPSTLRHVSVALADVSTASSAYIASPYSGRVVYIQGTLANAITVADSAVTTAIGGVAITGGGFTAAYTASAAGTIFNATPTAANIVQAGQLLTVTSDGGSTTTCVMPVTFTIDVG